MSATTPEGSPEHTRSITRSSRLRAGNSCWNHRSRKSQDTLEIVPSQSAGFELLVFTNVFDERDVWRDLDVDFPVASASQVHHPRVVGHRDHLAEHGGVSAVNPVHDKESSGMHAPTGDLFVTCLAELACVGLERRDLEVHGGLEQKPHGLEDLGLVHGCLALLFLVSLVDDQLALVDFG